MKIVLRGICIAYLSWSMLIVSGLDIESYKYRLEPICDELFPYAENGLALARIEDHYGYVNQWGDFKIETTYKDAQSFSSGLAGVLVDEKYGYINKANEIVIDPIYEVVEPFIGDFAVVKEFEKYLIIDKKGQPQLEDRFDELFIDSEDLIRYKKDGRFGYLLDGIDYQTDYDYIGPFVDDRAVVSLNNKYGFIDTENHLVIDVKYDSISTFLNDKAVVENNQKFGVVDTMGNLLVPIEHDAIQLFEEGDLIAFKEGYDWGYMTIEGDPFITPEYDKVHPFYDGLARIEINKKHGFINKENEYIIRPTYNDASWYADNGLMLIKKNIFYGYINRDNEYVVEPSFDDATDFFSNRTAYIKDNRKWGIIVLNYRLNYYVTAALPVIFLVITVSVMKRLTNLLKRIFNFKRNDR